MSHKNQLPILSKLYSIYETIPENFLDETDIDSYFYHSILEISKGSKKKIVHYQDFQV